MIKLCDLDPAIFRCVTPELGNSEVIITEERILHIKEHHPNDYERYSQYIVKMLRKPQYILADPVPNTAVILHEFIEADERFRLIVRLAVAGDSPDRKNSVITFMKISKKKYKKY